MEENKLFCILDAPNKDAVNKHHQKFGLKCDWITEAGLLHKKSSDSYLLLFVDTTFFPPLSRAQFSALVNQIDNNGSGGI